MDPLNSLSIAASVFQFLDFGSKVLSKTSEIYNSAEGISLKSHDLGAIASSMLDHSRELEQQERELRDKISAPIDENELRSRRHRSSTWKRELKIREQRQEELLLIINGCKVSSVELLNNIEKLKVQGPNNKWKSFYQALQSVWREQRMGEMFNRIERYRNQLSTLLLTSIREAVQSTESAYVAQFEQLQNIQSTEDRTNTIVNAIFGQVSRMDQWKAEIIAAIYHQNSSFCQNNASTSGQLEFLSSKLSNRAKAQWAHIQSDRLIERLRFHEMFDRKTRISNAHHQTFDWVYSPPDTLDSKWSSFIDWLEGDSSLYWITGKPGSGKSTLVKYLFDNDRTALHARHWSRGSPIIQAGFFFWNSGTEMQMSNIGLMQALLYDCLRQRPYLVRKVFTDRWRRCELLGDDLSPWSWEELFSAFFMFCELETRHSHLLFFLDGLDEFRGRHQDLVDLVRRLSNAPSVKVCASSRPWLVFEDAFKMGPNLMLQDLTIPDILCYASDKLAANHQFASLKQREPQYASNLVTEIAQRSSGVFLWVHLVVESLLDGLTNSDRIIDLKRRLEMIPPDLDGFYGRILSSSDNFYFEHTSQLFRIFREAQGSMNLLDFSFADEENPDFALQAPIQALSHREKADRCESTRRRINSRTKGLLDIPSLDHQKAEENHLQLPKGSHHRRSQSPSARSGRSAMDPYETYSATELSWLKVEYLHRTVRDYLEKREVWDGIVAGSPLPFDPSLALAKACLLRLKDYAPDSLSGVEYNMWHVTKRCVEYISDAEKTTGIDYSHLRCELARLAQRFAVVPRPERDLDGNHAVKIISSSSQGMGIRTLDPEWLRTTVAGVSSGEFLSFQSQTDFYERVRGQVETGSLQTHDENRRPLLTYALLDFEPFSILQMRLLDLLLRFGADPNESYCAKNLLSGITTQTNFESSPWRDLLCQVETCGNLRNKYQELYMRYWLGIIEIFVNNGADVRRVPFSNGAYFETILSACDLQREGKELDFRLRPTTSSADLTPSEKTSTKSKIKSRVIRIFYRRLGGSRSTSEQL